MSKDFTRTDTPTIMDGLVVRYQRYDDRQEISASRNRVCVDVSFSTAEDFERVITTIRKAWAQHRALEPSSRFLSSRVAALDEAAATAAATPEPVKP